MMVKYFRRISCQELCVVNFIFSVINNDRRVHGRRDNFFFFFRMFYFTLKIESLISKPLSSGPDGFHGRMVQNDTRGYAAVYIIHPLHPRQSAMTTSSTQYCSKYSIVMLLFIFFVFFFVKHKQRLKLSN